jgi:hypothetical protein
MHDYVGYELDEPSLRGEEGTPTYICAIIIDEELPSSFTEVSTKRYRINIENDKEPIVVDARQSCTSFTAQTQLKVNV